MKIPTRTQLVIRESEMIMLTRGFKILAVALARADPGSVDPALHAVLESVAADLTELAEKFPKGIAPDHPLAVTARRFQQLVAETRAEIAAALKPH